MTENQYYQCMEAADIYFDTILGDMGYVSEATDEELQQQLTSHTNKMIDSGMKSAAGWAVGKGARAIGRKNYSIGGGVANGAAAAARGYGKLQKWKAGYHAVRGGIAAARLGYRKIKRKFLGDASQNPQQVTPHGPDVTHQNYANYLQTGIRY